MIALVAGAINMKDFLAFGRGVSLSIPKSARPGIRQRMRALMNQESLALAIGVATLSQHRLQEKEGRVLKLLSGLVMAGLGICLIAPHG